MILAPLAAAALAAQPAPAFDPVEFFRGRTHGEGRLKAMLQKPKTITVESRGYPGRDGFLVLEQVIREPGKPPRTRYWRMRRDGPKHFSGTLTDAAGPVRVDVTAGDIRIRYKAKDNFDFEQRLTPQGPGTVHNKMKIRRFGITVATFDELIRKVD